MRLRILRWALATLCVGLTACALGSTATDSISGPPNTVVVQGPEAGDASEAAQISLSPPTAALYFGNALCNASQNSGCYPDNLSNDPTTTLSCNAAPDGGTYDPEGGYADAALACRVARTGAGPQAQCSLGGTNQDGASCHLSSDCTVGDECVGNPGVCRHYCCSGVGPCSATQFCDIRPKAEDPTLEVPVCIPLRPCGLIDEWSDAGVCPPMETCAVARDETGATSCVPIGGAGEGESCAKDHCGAGLICLGFACFKLCHTATSSECATGEVCKAALPLFPNPLVGICETPTDAGY
jgi:hypothetical protein